MNASVTSRYGFLFFGTLCVLATCICKVTPASAQATDRAVQALRDGRVLVTGNDAALRDEIADGSALGGGVTFRLVPVAPPAGAPAYPAGTTVDEANQTLSIPGGPARRVWLEPRVSNWGLCAEGARLTFLQATFGPASFLPAGVVVPDVPCTSSEDCAPLGFVAFDSCPSTTCSPMFFDRDNPLSVNPPLTAISATNIACGWVFQGPGALDVGMEAYACTLVLDVEAGFLGTVQIPFRNVNVDTLVLVDPSGQCPIVQALPATIEVLDDEYCCQAGVCSVGGPPGTCAAMGMTVATGACLGDCDSNGVDDACQGMIDCNGNGVGDTCDVTLGGAPDCNNNFKPDECESQTDCDNNGVQDICDVANKELGDCNYNNIPDACDIAAGNEPDEDGNGVIDYCERRSRFVYFDAPAGQVAIRLKFLNLDLFEEQNGDERWLGAPAEYANGVLPGTFWASRAECSPTLTTWPAGERLYVYGSSVVPNSEYEIRFADAACLASGEESCMSPPIVRTTSRWADVRSPYLGHPSNFQPNAADVNAIVRTFQGFVSALHYTRGRIAEDSIDPNTFVSLRDVDICNKANSNPTYPYDGPDPCP